MADEQPQPLQYPYFPVSAEGLKRLHQEYGQKVHLSIEQGVRLESLTEKLQEVQVATHQFTAKHTGDGCRSSETVDPLTNGHAEMPTAQATPTPMRTAGRQRGG